MRRNLSRPAGLDEPEVCECGHYGYVHGLTRCGCWAHPEHSWRGRVRFGRVRVSLKCPCRRGWVGGELTEPLDDWGP